MSTTEPATDATAPRPEDTTSCPGGVVRHLSEPGPAASRTAQYVGWFRPHRGARFEQIVQAATFDLCWDQLLKALAQHGRRGGDSTVLPRGTDPNAGASARRPASAGR